MAQQIAKLNYLRIAPRKVRLLADTLKGLRASEAEAQLLVRPQRAKGELLKLLRSAVANAKHNQKMDPDRLVISSIRVDKGPMLKRFLPRAQGRATPIHKVMSHVTLVLTESEAKTPSRFVILPPPKKEKKEKAKTAKEPKPSAEKEASTHRKNDPGFFKRFFRRKSV